MPSVATANISRRSITTLVSGATTTGASTILFASIQQQLIDSATLIVQVVPTGTFTVLKLNLEASFNGGTTWSVMSAWDAVANPITSFQTSEQGLYRLNCTTFTGGTSFNVLGCLAGSTSGSTSVSTSVAGTVTANQGTAGVSPWLVTTSAPTYPTTATLTRTVISFNTTGANTLNAAVSAKTTRVFRIFLTVSAATVLTFLDGATALSGAMTFTSGGSFTLDLALEPWFVTSTNSAFVCSQSGTAQVSGCIYTTQS
jgi:hypothetical protein